MEEHEKKKNGLKNLGGETVKKVKTRAKQLKLGIAVIVCIIAISALAVPAINVADESSGSAFDLDSFTSTNDSTALNNTVNTSAANSNYAIFWR